jgi:hypothetical protein
MAGAHDALLEPLRGAVRARAPLVPPAQIRIMAAELGASAGAIGAALAGAGLADGGDQVDAAASRAR